MPADNEVQLMVPQMLLSMILAAFALDVDDHATAARERDFAVCGSHVTAQLCTYIFDSVFPFPCPMNILFLDFFVVSPGIAAGLL